MATEKETGVELIANERQINQIEKHGFTAEHHAQHPEWYDKGQLLHAARLLTLSDDNVTRPYYNCPENWDAEWVEKLMKKPYLRRLTISGAFIASEIDRLQYLETTPIG